LRHSVVLLYSLKLKLHFFDLLWIVVVGLLPIHNNPQQIEASGDCALLCAWKCLTSVRYNVSMS